MTMRVAGWVALAALAACAGGPGASGGGTADARNTLSGVVTGVEPGPETTRVRVAPDAHAEPGRGPFALLVRADTEILLQSAEGPMRRGTVADLVPGTPVVAEHTGVQLRSLAPQYHVTRIRILRNP